MHQTILYKFNFLTGLKSEYIYFCLFSYVLSEIHRDTDSLRPLSSEISLYFIMYFTLVLPLQELNVHLITVCPFLHMLLVQEFEYQFDSRK